jgi:hypothetical protein
LERFVFIRGARFPDPVGLTQRVSRAANGTLPRSPIARNTICNCFFDYPLAKEELNGTEDDPRLG